MGEGMKNSQEGDAKLREEGGPGCMELGAGKEKVGNSGGTGTAGGQLL